LRPSADKRGRDWCGEWRVRVLTAYRQLCAAVRLTLAPEEPSPAATAILRIERLAAEPFAKQRSVRRFCETEDDVRDVIPLDRMVARTQR
jgi:hypothetical protein